MTPPCLGQRRTLFRRDPIVIGVAFVASHAVYWLIGLGGPQDPGAAAHFFGEMNLGGPLLPAAAGLVGAAILAPVCEEPLYRGVVLRPVHDRIARRGSRRVAAVGILVSAVAFALPHLGGSLTGVQAMQYLATGVVLAVVYLVTGLMTAAMVSHSLQSCFAFAQILLFGNGGSAVSPVLYVIVFGCPLWVYLCARALHAILPAGTGTGTGAGAGTGAAALSPDPPVVPAASRWGRRSPSIPLPPHREVGRAPGLP